MRILLRASTAAVFLLTTANVARADATPQTQPFAQSWTDPALITTPDVWTGVAGINGYNGTGMGTSGTADPQMLLGEGTQVLQVFQNHANPDTFSSGGVTEFDGIPNPTIAIQGSGTAGAPNIVITLVTTGRANVHVSYLLRDLDGSADDAIQRVALQYRVGTTGSFTNIPAGYVPDATMAGSATMTTAVSVTLPAACENQAIVQVRVITANATGNDEWVGVDDISITSSALACGNGAIDAGEACDAGTMNGTTTCGCQTSCQYGAMGTTCLAAGTDPCDVADTCNGSGACMPRVAAAGTSCRPAAGTCDQAETCDGVSGTCPADALVAAGMQCRLRMGLCDVPETCNGTSAACPTDLHAPDGSDCDDHLVCNGADSCMAGTCTHAGAPDCSDTNACTVDACVESTPMCTHALTAAPDCCSTATDCDDGDVCTTDACTGAGGVCTFDPVPDCCVTTADCNDLDPCTIDTCDATSNHCSHVGSCDGGLDASVPSDAGVDAGGDGGGSGSDASRGHDAGRTTMPRSAGCACRAGAGSSGVAGLASLALVSLAVLARRRRRALSSR